MGLFHKTLKDAKILIEKGELDKAKKILDKHIRDELFFDHSLGYLKQWTNFYINDINNAIGWIDKKNYPNEVINYINRAIEAWDTVETTISKMVKLEKVKLK